MVCRAAVAPADEGRSTSGARLRVLGGHARQLAGRRVEPACYGGLPRPRRPATGAPRLGSRLGGELARKSIGEGRRMRTRPGNDERPVLPRVRQPDPARAQAQEDRQLGWRPDREAGCRRAHGVLELDRVQPLPAVHAQLNVAARCASAGPAESDTHRCVPHSLSTVNRPTRGGFEASDAASGEGEGTS